MFVSLLNAFFFTFFKQFFVTLRQAQQVCVYMIFMRRLSGRDKSSQQSFLLEYCSISRAVARGLQFFFHLNDAAFSCGMISMLFYNLKIRADLCEVESVWDLIFGKKILSILVDVESQQSCIQLA